MSLIALKNVSKIFGPEEAHLAAYLNPNVSSGWQTLKKELEYGKHNLALHDISLELLPKEINVIMGLSGSGKSTLIRLINALIFPSYGQIYVDGEDVTQMSSAQITFLRRFRMSMVFQQFALLPHRNVRDNVSWGLRSQGVDKKTYQAKAAQWIERVGLQGYERSYPHQLSGGMKQRVGLARALATDTDILLMDEAFSALDPLIRSEMQDLLMDLQSDLKKTVVFISHDLDEAIKLGKKVTILKHGHLEQEGTPEDILMNPQNGYIRSFTKSVNRCHVLTARSAMQPSSGLVIDNDPVEVQNLLAEVQERPAEPLHCVDGQGKFLGTLNKNKYVELSQLKQLSKMQIPIQPTDAVDESTPLEKLIPKLLHSDRPLALIDKEKKYVGSISTKQLLKAIVHE